MKNKHVIVKFSKKLRRNEWVAMVLPLKKKENVIITFKKNNNELVALVLPFKKKYNDKSF